MIRSNFAAAWAQEGGFYVTGGLDGMGNALTTSEFYRPWTGTFTVTTPLNQARASHTATTLYDGRVLVAGGQYKSGNVLVPTTSAETTPLSNTGNSCNLDAECTSGYCVHETTCANAHCITGYCCNSRCSTSCGRCDGSVNYAGSQGLCTPVALHTLSEQPYCGAFLCDGTHVYCPSSCASDADCEANLSGCVNNVCVWGHVNGHACTQAADCLSGFCTDGVCCNSACGGGVTTDCQACSIATGAAANGTCGAVAAGKLVCRASTNPCDPAESCDGAALTCPADISNNCTITVTTDKAMYASGDVVNLTYTGMAGNSHDWIGIAVDGSPAASYLQFAYTGGAKSGVMAFSGLPAASLRARAFLNDSYVISGQSAVFTVASGGATAVSTDKLSYAAGANIVVSYSGMAGYPHDWVDLAVDGSPLANYVRFMYTGGRGSGSITFGALPSGTTYRARAFFNDTYTLAAQSSAFTVAAQVASAMVVTNGQTFTAGQPVIVTYSGMAGFPHDWIAIAPSGAPAAQYIQFNYTGGYTSGTMQFNQLPVGQWRARAFNNDSYTIAAESPAFSVQ